MGLALQQKLCITFTTVCMYNSSLDRGWDPSVSHQEAHRPHAKFAAPGLIKRVAAVLAVCRRLLACCAQGFVLLKAAAVITVLVWAVRFR